MNVPGIVLHPSPNELLDAYVMSPAHAALLAGNLGTGKTHIAQVLAQRLLGTDRLENQAYFRVVRPKDGNIAIEQIRNIIRFFHLQVPGKAMVKRVALIEDADAMGIEAQNALLKLLEEPPVGSVLLLTSSEPQQLLPTIRSRVQLIQLTAPETAALVNHFATLGYSEAAVSSAMLRSGGNVARAAAWLQDDRGGDNDIIDKVKQALAGTSYERMLLVDSLAKQREIAAEFVTSLATIASASLETAAIKGSTNVERWRSILAATLTAQNAIEKNGNVKLVVTELMLAI